MALRRYCWILLFAVPLSGCGVTKELCRYTREQVEYHEIGDECLAKARYRKLAQASLSEYAACNADVVVSSDFSDGFTAGFVDYLNEGPGAAPIVPPRCYWKIFHESPEGNQRAQDWFDGFHAGILSAEQSGYRDLAIVPVSVPPIIPSRPLSVFESDTIEPVQEPLMEEPQ